MVTSRLYDAMYRWWAPWDSDEPRDDLRWLLRQDAVDAVRGGTAADLGCGTGTNVVHLAAQGFTTTGIDFSRVAVDAARQRAADAGVADRCRFLQADLTDPDAALGGPYDLLLDFGALDDLRPAGRRAMARTVARIARPGALFLLWCFQARPRDLPRISFHGPSRLSPGLAPAEEHELFGDTFDIEVVHRDRDGAPVACYLLTRRATDGAGGVGDTA